MRSNLRSTAEKSRKRGAIASRRRVLALRVSALVLALAGTAAAFDVGAHAGAALNGRVMAISVARVPMPMVASPDESAVHTHVR